MDLEGFQEAVKKFDDYLKANGLRPIATVMHVVDDASNQEYLAAVGLPEVVADSCIRVMAHQRGYRLSL